MKKIVFLDAGTMGEDISLEPLSSLGELTVYPHTAPEEVSGRIKECDVLIVNKVRIGAPEIDAAPRLKLICVAATGTNNIDIPYAESKGIPVKNAAGYSTESVAQTTFAVLLSLVQPMSYYDEAVKSGRYSRSGSFTDVSRSFFELKGKKLGIIGLGNIGSRVARLAEAFGMEAFYYPTGGVPHSQEYRALSLEELLRECDVISIHAPLNDRTRNLIGYDEIRKMKPSSYLINMGRGGIVNEADLARALDEGAIAGAGIDVFEKEPLPEESPYLKLSRPERILLTPHIGWASREARACLVEKIAENIRNTPFEEEK